ncbi:MAG: hypothetical protein PHP86_17990 [Nevskiales bacterium]|nr:hypothetical protein [Nevskiales bacterium]
MAIQELSREEVSAVSGGVNPVQGLIGQVINSSFVVDLLGVVATLSGKVVAPLMDALLGGKR